MKMEGEEEKQGMKPNLQKKGVCDRPFGTRASFPNLSKKAYLVSFALLEWGFP
jgi:hypothetical protein